MRHLEINGLEKLLSDESHLVLFALELEGNQTLETSTDITKKVSFNSLLQVNNIVSYPHILVLSSILAIVLILGAISLNHGLPYYVGSSEGVYVRRSVKMAAFHYPTPGYFGHPGSTVYYPLAVVYKLWGSVSSQSPVWQQNPDLAEPFEENPAFRRQSETDWVIYIQIGRWFNLLYFIAGIVVTYVVGRQVWDKRVALLAAWFMALTPMLMKFALVVRSDHAGLLFLMLGFLACCRLFSSQKWYDYAIAGIIIGVAGSSRYFNLSLGATLILTHFLVGAHQESGHWKRLTIGISTIGFGLLITTPAWLFNFNDVYDSLVTESRPAAVSLIYLRKLWWYLSYALPEVLTWPIWLLAIIGMTRVWYKQNKKTILLSFGFIMFLLTISVPSLYEERWLIPIIPLSLLFAAKTLWMGIDAISHQQKIARWEKPVAILLLLGISIIPLKETIRHTYLNTRPDTYVLAMQWIEENLPPDSRIVRDKSAPPLSYDKFSLTLWPYYRWSEIGFDELIQHDYFITNELEYERVFENADSIPEIAAFYQQLFENKLIAEFKPDPWKTNGPTIRIYKIQESSFDLTN